MTAALFLLLQADPDATPAALPASAHGSAITEILHNSGPVAFAVLL